VGLQRGGAEKPYGFEDWVCYVAGGGTLDLFAAPIPPPNGLSRIFFNDSKLHPTRRIFQSSIVLIIS